MTEPRMSRRQRIVHRRMVIRGDLLLTSPTHLGNGDADGPTDMALLRDGYDPNQILLTGASIAGALRSYLRSYEQGLFVEEPAQESWQLKGLAELLFGGRKADDEGYQSALIVNDALAVPLTYELRDGVQIDGKTRTPEDKTKYDLELIAAGTIFPLLLELAFPYRVDLQGARVSDGEQQLDEQQLLNALAIALRGLASGEITLGMKKQRGFGRCRVDQWQVWDFDLTNQHKLLAWLALDPTTATSSVAHWVGSDITQLLGQTVVLPADQRKYVTLTATFALTGSLLIRSGHDQAVLGPDVRHLHAHQAGSNTSSPVLAGTSLAGVLRHRTERIANTLVAGSGTAVTSHMFGRMGASQRKTVDAGQCSRLIVHETEIIDATTDLIQNRVSIDRFTGGAYDGALFNAQPVFAKPTTRVTIRLDLFAPDKPVTPQTLHDPLTHDERWEAEQALMLLLLKDLWTGDLPVGGESSIGRGRLRGIDARFTRGETVIAAFADDGTRVRLIQGDQAALNSMVAVLPTTLAKLKETTNVAA